MSVSFFLVLKKNALNKKALEELQKENIAEDYNPYPPQLMEKKI